MEAGNVITFLVVKPTGAAALQDSEARIRKVLLEVSMVLGYGVAQIMM